MNLSDQEINRLLEAVRLAAKTEIMPRFRHLQSTMIETKTGPNDLVTIADKASEAIISQKAKEILPQALIIGEEACETDPTLLQKLPEADLAVIIDPIDGTSNYVRNLSTFGVILAVVSKGRTIFGLLYDAVMDDWVYASAGEGVWFASPEAKPIQLTPQPDKPIDILQAYIPFNIFPKDTRVGLFGKLNDLGRINSLGCSCQEYRTIAFSRAELILSPVIKPWDHVAGLMIVEELGGRVGLVETEERPKLVQKTGTLLVTRHKELWPKIRAMIV